MLLADYSTPPRRRFSQLCGDTYAMGSGPSVTDRRILDVVARGRAASAPGFHGDQEAVDLAGIRFDPNEHPAPVRDERARARELPLVDDPDLVDVVGLRAGGRP